MSSEPIDVLGVARELSKGKSDAHWRSASSRAYYAGYHAAKLWHASLPAPGDPCQAKGDHEDLIQRLLHPAKQCATEQRRLSLWLSGQLSAMRALRATADYELATSFTLDEAALACGLAGGVLDRVQTKG